MGCEPVVEKPGIVRLGSCRAIRLYQRRLLRNSALPSCTPPSVCFQWGFARRRSSSALLYRVRQSIDLLGSGPVAC